MTPPLSCNSWQTTSHPSIYDETLNITCAGDQLYPPSYPPPNQEILQSTASRVQIPAQSSVPQKSTPSMTQNYQQTNYEFLPEFNSRYCLRQELGAGGFGFVYSAVRLQDEREVAVKFIFKNKVPEHGWVVDPARKLRIPMEIYVLKEIKHKNIVEFYEAYEDNQFYYLVMELHGTPWSDNNPLLKRGKLPVASSTFSVTQPLAINNGPNLDGNTRPPRRASCDLFECIEHCQRFDEEAARHIFEQIVDVVHFLALHNIFHRDIKDENIVVDAELNVKLIDFGSAVIRTQAQKLSKFSGTINYTAPEILHGQKYYAEPAEVWSLGVLLYTILYGDSPFSSPEHACLRPWAPPKFKSSQEVLNLIDRMLKKNPKERATLCDVIEHPWLKRSTLEQVPTNKNKCRIM